MTKIEITIKEESDGLHMDDEVYETADATDREKIASTLFDVAGLLENTLAEYDEEVAAYMEMTRKENAMKPEVKCRRVTVNLNQVEVNALLGILCRDATKGQARCAKSAIRKVVDAWRAEKTVTAAKQEAAR